MKEKEIRPEDAAKLIRDLIEDSITSKEEHIEEGYHHNSAYKDGASIAENGILSIEELQERGIWNISQEQLDRLSITDSHINDINGISLSKVGMKDLYKDENEYNPKEPGSLDFIIDKTVPASRKTEHYGNEFITSKIITPDHIESVDIRFLKLIKKLLENEKKYGTEYVDKLIENYLWLKSTASSIRKKERNIIMRENSEEQDKLLDIDRLAEMPIVHTK